LIEKVVKVVSIRTCHHTQVPHCDGHNCNHLWLRIVTAKSVHNAAGFQKLLFETFCVGQLLFYITKSVTLWPFVTICGHLRWFFDSLKIGRYKQFATLKTFVVNAIFCCSFLKSSIQFNDLQMITIGLTPKLFVDSQTQAGIVNNKFSIFIKNTISNSVAFLVLKHKHRTYCCT
jgi:hypothetical protein